MATVDIIRYQAKHHEAVLRLQQRLWSPSLELNDCYFRWKFIDNPHAQFGGTFLAEARGRIVGMRGFMGTLWTDPGGARVPIALAGDTVVAADYEGRGIVKHLSDTAIAEFARRGVGLVVNTSASPRIFSQSLRSGWKTIGHYRRLRRNPTPSGGRSFIQTLRSIGGLPEKIASGPDDSFAGRDGAQWRLDRTMTVSLSSIANPAALAAISDISTRATKYVLIRDPAFFKWRFTNPFFRYYFLTCWREGSLVAYLTLSFRKQGHRSITIIDWNSVQQDYFRCLVDCLTRRFPEISITMLINGCSAAEKQDLLEAGFCEIVDPDTPGCGVPPFKPGVLVAPAVDQAACSQVRSLVEGGFERLEFKGIESDSA
jgi:GNAT superfamily N-acetyltransferase